jgi:CRP-like cAMP-binding protein
VSCTRLMPIFRCPWVGRYFVSDGLLELVLGHEVELVTLLITKGSYFGEYSLILSIPKHNASVRAITAVELLSLGKEEFDFVGSFFPQIFEKVLAVG